MDCTTAVVLLRSLDSTVMHTCLAAEHRLYLTTMQRRFPTSAVLLFSMTMCSLRILRLILGCYKPAVVDSPPCPRSSKNIGYVFLCSFTVTTSVESQRGVISMYYAGGNETTACTFLLSSAPNPSHLNENVWVCPRVCSCTPIFSPSSTNHDTRSVFSSKKSLQRVQPLQHIVPS